MARQSDVFTAAQAAQVLGISERRVRQLVTEGKLPGKRDDDNIVRIPQQAVNEERKRRRGKTGATTTAAGVRSGRKSAKAQPVAADVDVDAIAEKVASVVGRRLEGQLEVTQRAESLLRVELDEERARRTQAEAQLSATRAELADAHARLDEARQRVSALETQAQQRRGLFRR